MISVVTLCGSTRFMEQFQSWNKALSLAGHCVFSVGVSVKGDWKPDEIEKEVLDMVHFDKVALAQTVLVIDQPRNPGQDPSSLLDGEQHPYIGYSTRREIMWANMRGKNIVYVSDLPDIGEYNNLLAPRFESSESIFDRMERD